MEGEAGRELGLLFVGNRKGTMGPCESRGAQIDLVGAVNDLD